MGQIVMIMATSKLKIQHFRANDLVDNGGKQFEMGKGWCQEFFEIDNSVEEITLLLTFKALSKSQQSLDNTQIKLKLSDVNTRGDRKAYANGENGHSQIKDFFINKLHLTTSNLTDYFALYKKNQVEYNLYYVPKFLYDNFICLFNNGLDVSCQDYSLKKYGMVDSTYTSYRSYITAIKSKPFLLLAGISGTGKSRIVRELARACWEESTDEYKAQKPKNFQMVQVKPNWHDSSDLIGYVSRVSGKAEFVAGEFLKFIAKAWEDTETPYFLCLDEMNLAPVEQYFAEYLSVIESRKSHEDGTVTTDPIIYPEYESERNKETEELVPKLWYKNLVSELLADCPPEKAFALNKQFINDGISIPQNLIVVGTVNMDETTFSFSRKVLDRAMTIEMNEVDLHGGLTKRHERIGKLGNAELVGSAVEGVDVYNDYTDVCDIALGYLQKVNDVLEGAPFKIAYRTRNEFLLYAVNNLPYCKDENGNDLEQGYVIARALDEITSMKVLSRIEGDDTKVSDELLDNLSKAIEDGLKTVSGEENTVKSISLAKLKEMKAKLVSGYTSFWS
jgi:hypothetical protein